MSTTVIVILALLGLFALGIWSQWLKWKRFKGQSDRIFRDDVTLPTTFGDPWPAYRDELKEVLLLAARTSPDNGRIFAELIEIAHKLSEERSTSPYQFEEALRVDERHADALRELRALKALLEEPGEESQVVETQAAPPGTSS